MGLGKMQVGLGLTTLPHTLAGPQYPDNSEQAKVRFLVLEGAEVGGNVISVGLAEGQRVGAVVGVVVGREGASVGAIVGSSVGSGEGPKGEAEGAKEGCEGAIVGDTDGAFVGDNDGAAVGYLVGAFVLAGSVVW